MMKKRFMLLIAALAALLAGCASGGSARKDVVPLQEDTVQFQEDAVPLQEDAVSFKDAADKFALELAKIIPMDATIAVMVRKSPLETVNDYLIDTINGALRKEDRFSNVIDRENLDRIAYEQQIQEFLP